MHYSLAREFMQCVGVDLHPPSLTGRAKASCPLAEWRHKDGSDHKPSFLVKCGPQKSTAKCYACNWGGALVDLLFELQLHKADVAYKDANRILDQEWDGLTVSIELLEDTDPVFEFPEWHLNSYPYAWLCEPARDYLLTGRKHPVPLIVAEELDLRWDASRQRVCFPIRDRLGRFCGLHGRDITGKSDLPYLAYTYKSHQNPTVLLGEDMVDPDRPVVVAESVFDYARVYQVYRNVVTPKTASIHPAQMAKIAGWFHVISFFDGDKAGEDAAYRIKKARPGKTRITANASTPKGEDGDSLGVEGVSALLEPLLQYAGGLDPILLDQDG